MKRKKLVIIFLIICFVVVVLLLKPKNPSFNIMGLNETNRICQIGDDYYYTEKDGVYRYGESEPFIKTDESILLASYNDCFYVCNSGNGNIKMYTTKGEMIDEIDLDTAITCFTVYNDSVIYVDDEKKLYIQNEWVAINLSETEVIYSKISDFHCFKYEKFDGVSIYSKESNNSIFHYIDRNSGYIPFAEENFFIVSDSTNRSDVSFYKYIKEDMSCQGSVMLPIANYIPFYVQTVSDKIIYVATSEPLDPHVSRIEARQLKYHIEDSVLIIDADSLEIEKHHETKKYERILYADTEKAITYYKGNYCTYSMSDWKLLEKQSAREIKNGGSYSFEVCGDLLFVFDDETDELINSLNLS